MYAVLSQPQVQCLCNVCTRTYVYMYEFKSVNRNYMHLQFLLNIHVPHSIQMAMGGSPLQPFITFSLLLLWTYIGYTMDR